MPDDPYYSAPPGAAEPDTRPKPPAGWRAIVEPSHEEQAARLLADPQEWAGRRAPRPDHPRPRLLITAAVMAGMLCLCLALVGMAGFAGYRDGLATNDAKVTQTLATGIAEQYVAGSADLQAGRAEMAALRFSWIVETIQAPTQYALDSPVQLAVARTVAAFSPTPPPAPTLTPTLSLTPTITLTPPPPASATPTLSPLEDPAYFYDQAQIAMRLARYETAIEWLDALIALDPTYRPAEVQPMLLEALTQQGRLYLTGQNPDGEDRLARGVYLIYRADELGTVEPEWLLGQARFVEMYVNARNYVDGGYYATAIPMLEELCRFNCQWSYHGVSVEDLLARAQAGAGN